jgi:uncharacterized protein (DUF488 family)
VELLRAHGIQAVADVRRFPGSRRHPHFAREQLEPWLQAHGIAYRWMPELGGRRRPRPDSVNTGWRVDAFRGYADYLETADAALAITSLVELARDRPTAVMCAEALWWQCHRRLIADRLLTEGHAVLHIETATKASPHKLVPPAHMREGKLSYAAEQLDL